MAINKYYQRDKAKYTKRTVARNIKKKLFMWKLKSGKCCKICGWNEHTEILEFHHRDPAKKEHGISYIFNERLILKEIEKCILVCPSCHRWIHYPKEGLNES